MITAYINIVKGKIPHLDIALPRDKVINVYSFYDTYSFEVLESILMRENLEKICLMHGYGLLYDYIKNTFPDISLTTIDKHHVTNFDVLKHPNVAVAMFIKQNNLDIDSYNILHKEIPGRMLLGDNVIGDLDILGQDKSIYNLLNSTNTKMGQRLLLQNLLHPYADCQTVTTRHNKINFFAEHPNTVELLTSLLSKLPDIDHANEKLSRIAQNYKKQACLGLCYDLNNILTCFYDILNLETSVLEVLKEEKTVVDEVFTSLNGICDFSNLFFAKKSLDPYLDVSLQMYIENQEDMQNSVSLISNTLGIKAMMVYDKKFGFVIKVPSRYSKVLKISSVEYANIEKYNVSALDNRSSLTENIYKETSKSASMHLNDQDYSAESDNKDFSTDYEDLEGFYTFDNKNKSTSSLKTQFMDKTRCQTNFVCESDTTAEQTSMSNTMTMCKNDNQENSEYLKISTNEEFILLVKKKEFALYTTTKLHKRNLRLISCRNQIIDIFYVFCYNMLVSNIHITRVLHRFSRVLSELDLALCFYKSLKKDCVVLPERSDVVSIVSSTHPLVKGPSVRNCVFASDKMNFTVITGPNMSGKSTYIKQIGISIILHQIGAPVIAKSAKLRFFNKLYTHSTREDFDTNTSTFTNEIIQIRKMMEKCDENTLVLIDELGRGTNWVDGLSFVIATCNRLAYRQAYVFFATHFSNLLEHINHNNVSALEMTNNRLKSGSTCQSTAFDLCEEYLGQKIFLDAKKNRKILYNVKDHKFDNSIIQIAAKIQEAAKCKDKEKFKEKLKKHLKCSKK